MEEEEATNDTYQYYTVLWTERTWREGTHRVRARSHEEARQLSLEDPEDVVWLETETIDCAIDDVLVAEDQEA